MEIVPVINPENLHITDFQDRSVVSAQNLWHFSSLIVPVQEKTNNLLIQIRPKGKTFAGKMDIFGGYVRKNGLGESIKNEFNTSKLEELFLETAVREANEELQITVLGEKIIYQPTELIKIGDVGEFVANNDILKEVSSAYFLIIPSNASIQTFDDIYGEPVNIKSALWDFEDLIDLYKTSPHKFSDGIARILNKYLTTQRVKDDIHKIIKRFS